MGSLRPVNPSTALRMYTLEDSNIEVSSPKKEGRYNGRGPDTEHSGSAPMSRPIPSFLIIRVSIRFHTLYHTNIDIRCDDADIRASWTDSSRRGHYIRVQPSLCRGCIRLPEDRSWRARFQQEPHHWPVEARARGGGCAEHLGSPAGM